MNFKLLPNGDHLNDFIETYASHEHKRRSMIKTLTTEDIATLDSFDNDDPKQHLPTNTTETIHAMFKGMGINLVKE